MSEPSAISAKRLPDHTPLSRRGQVQWPLGRQETRRPWPLPVQVPGMKVKTKMKVNVRARAGNESEDDGENRVKLRLMLSVRFGARTSMPAASATSATGDGVNLRFFPRPIMVAGCKEGMIERDAF